MTKYTQKQIEESEDLRMYLNKKLCRIKFFNDDEKEKGLILLGDSGGVWLANNEKDGSDYQGNTDTRKLAKYLGFSYTYFLDDAVEFIEVDDNEPVQELPKNIIKKEELKEGKEYMGFFSNFGWIGGIAREIGGEICLKTRAGNNSFLFYKEFTEKANVKIKDNKLKIVGDSEIVHLGDSILIENCNSVIIKLNKKGDLEIFKN